jgi:hypothetical protein
LNIYSSSAEQAHPRPERWRVNTSMPPETNLYLQRASRYYTGTPHDL